MQERKGLGWPQVRVCVVTKSGGAPSASRTLIVKSFYRLNCSGPFNPFTVTFFKQWHALQTISCLYIRFVLFFFIILSILQRNLLTFQLKNLELLETSVVIVSMKENWNKMGKKCWYIWGWVSGQCSTCECILDWFWKWTCGYNLITVYSRDALV